MAAILHTSVLAPHLAPKMTSGDRYCLVCMSFVKWWLTQQAFPRSAIFTLITSILNCSSTLRFSPVREVLLVFSEMPETSRVRRSLEEMVRTGYQMGKAGLVTPHTQDRRRPK